MIDFDARFRISGSVAILAPGGVLCVSDLGAEDGALRGPGFEGRAGSDRPGLGWKIQETGFGPVTLSTPCVVRKDGGGVPSLERSAW